MERMTRRRAGVLLALFLAVVAFYALKTYHLQVVDNDGAVTNATTYTIYTTVKAARGDILDCNGNVLVTNRACYDLVFIHYIICSAADRNAILLDLVNVCRDMGLEYIDHFPVSDTAPFSYTLSSQSSTWQGYFQSYLTAKPKLDSDITAPLLMKQLRSYYNIPEDWSDEDARAVIGLRYELDLRNGVINSLSSYVFMEDVSSDALAAILELNVPGLKTEASVTRVYNTQYAAHILGYIGAMNAKQWEYYKTLTYEDSEGNTRFLYSMDALVGQDGLEQAYEEYLHGVDGVRKDVLAVDGTVLSSEYTVVPQAGKNVELSIDINVQAAAEDSMAELMTQLREGDPSADGSDVEGGAVVVMDVKTGQILACASYPTYNLSTFREDYNALLTADYQPLYNRALQALYPPGSTYKMSMVIAAIDSGTIGMYDEIFDSGVYMEYASANYKPQCLQYTNYGYGHGWINSLHALEKSCNYYFYYLADHMSIDVMDSTAAALGLGEKTGVELYEEAGRRANPTTKAALYSGDNSRWYISDQISAAIGQSDNRFTPLQLCVYTATLANRGVRYEATFLNRVLSDDYSSIILESEPNILSTLEISDEAYAAYTQGMRLVAQSGTASKYLSKYPIAVAAKTGTAETGILGTSDNGAFVCYAPYDDPEIAVVVYGEKAGHGSTMAQIGKAVLDAYFYDELYGDANIGENQIG